MGNAFESAKFCVICDSPLLPTSFSILKPQASVSSLRPIRPQLSWYRWQLLDNSPAWDRSTPDRSALMLTPLATKNRVKAKRKMLAEMDSASMTRANVVWFWG